MKTLLIATMLLFLTTDVGFCQYTAKSSKSDSTALGGFGTSKNAAIKIPDNIKKTHTKIFLHAEVDKKEVTVYLCNPGEMDEWFRACDSRLYLTREIQQTDGTWKSADAMPTTSCGNSFHRVCLKPGEAWKFVTPLTTDTLPMRYKLGLDPKTSIYSAVYKKK